MSLGGLAGIFTKSAKQKMADTLSAESAERAKKAEEEKKKKRAALKLAQLATGSGGILSDADTGRRKLFGN